MDMRWAHGGLTPDGLLPDAATLDLSVNINPYGPEPELIQHLHRQPFDQYPDPQQMELRKAWAAMRGMDFPSVMAGNGCNELFWAAARAFLKAGKRWVSIEPNYSEFARAAATTGAEKVELRAPAEADFRWSIEALPSLLEQHKPTLVLSSNPCSPTGFFQDPEAWQKLVRAWPHTLFALDHSFLSLSPHWRQAELIEWPDNVLRFQSLTKDFAIAGLRLGVVEAHPLLIRAMQEQMPTWSVNSLAQAAGLWIIRHHERLGKSRELLLADRERVEGELRKRGLHFVPSSTIFTMLRPAGAEDLRQRLWHKHGVLIRSCASYGLPDWWRIAARPAAAMQMFWKALDEELACTH